MGKPTVNTNPVANQHAGEQERIVEFSGGAADPSSGMRPGGLISLHGVNDGHLVVHVYRFDDTVKVSVAGHQLVRLDGERTSGLIDRFTADELECLVRTAAEMVNEYGDANDILSGRQVELAKRALAVADEDA